jgi:hypothetical protein
MRKGFLIYEEMQKYLAICEETFSHIDFATDPFNISIYMRKIFFSFLSMQFFYVFLIMAIWLEEAC